MGSDILIPDIRNHRKAIFRLSDPEIAKRDTVEFGRLLQGGTVKGFETTHVVEHWDCLFTSPP